MEHPVEMDDLGSTTILGNPHIYIYIHIAYHNVTYSSRICADWMCDSPSWGLNHFFLIHTSKNSRHREGLLFPSQRFDSLPYDPSRPTFVSWFTSPRGHQGVPMWQSQVRRPHHAGVHSSAFLGPDSSAGPGSPSEMPVARQERATVRAVSWGGWTQEIHFTIRLIYRGQIIWQNKKS